MKRVGMAIVVGTFLSMSAAAQSETGAQAGAQSSSQASVQTGQTQVQASGNASAATSASAQNGQANGSLATGSAFNAALNSPIDSKKCKPGDAVTAHTTEAAKSEGKTVIPKGSKLVGHVTQASARAKGESESALGIVFDKAILKNGQEVPLNVAIQAIASAQSGASTAGSDMDAMGGMGASAAGRGALGGVGSATGGAVGTWRSCQRSGEYSGERRWKRCRCFKGSGRRLERCRSARNQQPRRVRPERAESERGGFECHGRFGDYIGGEERTPGQRDADAAGFAGSSWRTGRIQAARGEQARAKIRAEVGTEQTEQAINVRVDSNGRAGNCSCAAFFISRSPFK